MKPKEIQDLIDFISKSGLNEVKIETEQLKLSIKREPDTKVVESQVVAAPAQAAPAPIAPAPAPAQAAPAPAAPKEAEKPSAAAEDKYITVKSPMIGTFYRAPNPETPSFVEVGDSIAEGEPICIIEAMKLFNEIESEVSGKIVKVLVENATPVEYDQPLFLVDPS